MQRLQILTASLVALALASCGGSKASPEVQRLDRVCGVEFPRDCSNPLEQCWPPYGCLSPSLHREQCAWLETNVETYDEKSVALVVASKLVPTLDEIHNHQRELAGRKASLRFLKFLTGIGVDGWQSDLRCDEDGFAATAPAKPGPMCEVMRSLANGLGSRILVSSTCLFTVHRMNGTQGYQAYYRFELPREYTDAFLVDALTALRREIEVQQRQNVDAGIQERTKALYDDLLLRLDLNGKLKDLRKSWQLPDGSPRERAIREKSAEFLELLKKMEVDDAARTPETK